ncbi:MAG: trimethylamine methyltransferase family protein [Novosphingobium sp.]
MNEMSSPSRSRGGREAKRAARLSGVTASAPYISRRIPYVELLDEEGLSLIEENAEKILSEIGCEFRDDPEALQIWKAAGAEVTGELVRMPRGMCRKLIQDNAPSEFVHQARNPARSTTIGGRRTVFAPTAGPPFVRCLDKGRRYGTIEDFNNFAKLTQASPYLHSCSTGMCEPVDLPVNKRHFDMFYGNAVNVDKPFFSAVSAPSRSEDCIEMAKILHGDRFVDPLTGENNTCLMGVMNGNSPLTYDATMLGAAKALARANQGVLVTPFIMAGAMAPTGLVGAVAVTLAEAMAGMAFLQLVKPGAPVIFGSFVTTLSMQSGAPTYGTPETSLIKNALMALARRLGVPSRTGGSLCASKIADAQAAYESAQTLQTTVLGGANFVLQSAGWLEGGLVTGYEKFMMDCDQLGMMHVLLNGYDLSENGQAMDAIREVGPGKHFFGCAHTQANFETAFYRSSLADYGSWEQWEAEGAHDIQQRANAAWKKTLAEFEAPPLDVAVHDELSDYIARRKAEMPDANY